MRFDLAFRWMRRVCSLALLFFLILPSARAASETRERPSLFLSCAAECFETYLRQELSYFDFSRDRFLADYTVVIVRQSNGGGGIRFSLELAARPGRAVNVSIPSRTVTVPPGATPEQTRTRLVRAILRLLYDGLDGTVHEDAFELSLPGRSGLVLSALHDPWNYWVITPELMASADAGSRYYFFETTMALTLRRITEDYRLRFRGAYTRNFSGYQLQDDSRIAGDVESYQLRALAARSIGKHFALGGLLTGGGNEFENLLGHIHGAPAAEYNIFPYEENAKKQLRFVYQAGIWANWYLEENVAGLMSEMRPYHAFSIIAEINQPFGSIGWIGQANQFIDEPELFRLRSGIVLSFRLVEGLALNVLGEVAAISDLINLRGRPITDEEILLWTAQQPTDASVKMEVGLSYAFGSRHNTIVNPRFARVDLDEE